MSVMTHVRKGGEGKGQGACALVHGVVYNE